jgi:hypothetical protein
MTMREYISRLDTQFLALQLMMRHGLIQNGWTFGISKGGTYTLGRCNHTTKTISLGIRYIESRSRADITETILHEIAHALCEPGEGHGPNWKAKCREVGCRPQRLHHRMTPEAIANQKAALERDAP